jgi:outer membrane receptor protein involved in Fe transport
MNVMNTTPGSRAMKALCAGASIAVLSGLLATGTAYAQTAVGEPDPAASTPPGDGSGDRVITVTGSRIANAAAPTPVRSLDSEDLQRIAPVSIADALNLLPGVRPTLSTRSTANETTGSGGNSLDLRGLGVPRTLLLVDGRRHVATSLRGGVDIDVIPQALIKGIDIVTGGVAAVYGSDAVAGVVNLRLDDRLEGVKATAQAGVSNYGDDENYLVSLALGQSFAGGRGHVVISGEFAESAGVSLDELYDREWAAPRWGLIANPAFTPTNAEPSQLLVQNAAPSNRAPGGLINNGPLRGTQFGPGGVPTAFQFGTLVTATTMQGPPGSDTPFYTQPASPLRRRTIFAKASYDLTDRLSTFVELSYGNSLQRFDDYANDTYVPQDTALTINVDNAFLPASIRTAMIDQGLTTFWMGRTNFDFAVPLMSTERETYRGVFGLEYDLGGGWNIDAYYSHGSTKSDFTGEGLRFTPNFNLALDAVIDPSTGTAVCRSTLTDPTNGCVPINLFGPGSVSDAAARYVSGTAFLRSEFELDVALATVRGSPFSTWAGPVEVVLGGEYRREQASADADERVGNWRPWGNNRPWDGSVSVVEGFGEVLLPLADDQAWAKALDINLAGRITDYSTSGSVTTWKAGLNYEPTDGVRVRVSRSRDIRAPALIDLFSTGGSLGTPIFDPFTGSLVIPTVTTRGNPNLRPEKADTLTAGLVVRPAFAPNLTVAIDYYRIEIFDALTTLSPDQTVQGCFNGNDDLCRLITRQDGVLAAISASPVNLDSIETDGVDFDMNYLVPDALGGQISFRALVTYINKLVATQNGIAKEFAGSIVQPTVTALGGQPHWKANGIITYKRDRFMLATTGRYTGGGVIDTTFTNKNLADLDRNGRFYTDLSMSYTFGNSPNATK